MAKILIVEDNLDNLNLVRLLMERNGYQVVTAIDGKIGLEMAATEKPDLILLDMDMPVISGWDFIREIKNNPDLQDIPIIVVTAHLLPGDRNRVIEVGCAGYVSKPFKTDELANEVERCLGDLA
jgi:CheY-like chemotaxis protein